MSTLAALIIIAVVLFLLAMLIAGGRNAAGPRARHELGDPDDDVEPYRSHAEASRRAASR